MALLEGVTINEALSEIFGSVSLTAWIFFSVPQLIANYKAQSAEALSPLFLFIWLSGDLTNLFGAFATQIAPIAVLLASYFCFSDLIIITQTLYYHRVNAGKAKRRSQISSSQGNEEQPLLREHAESSNTGSQRDEYSDYDSVARTVAGDEAETKDNGWENSSPWVSNALKLAAVWFVGIAAWFLSYALGAFSEEGEVPVPADPSTPTSIMGIVLGYTSAVCYLTARLPQIYKNYKAQSTEGLALLSFMLSLSGNLGYGLSVVTYSQDLAYLTKAFPFLLGSLGTVVEDCIIFYQFRLYAPRRPADDSKPAAIA